MIRVQDLGSMGRLTGVGHFSTQEAYDEEKTDMAELQHAKASLGEDYDPLDIEEIGDTPTVRIGAENTYQGRREAYVP